MDVEIRFRTGRYAPVHENVRKMVSRSKEQAVHDLIAEFLHNNPEYKIEIISTEVIYSNFP